MTWPIGIGRDTITALLVSVDLGSVVVGTIWGLSGYLATIWAPTRSGGTDVSRRSRGVIGYSAVIFVAVAAAEGVRYAASHRTIDVVVAVMAAIVAVLIIGTTALLARRSGKSPTRVD